MTRQPTRKQRADHMAELLADVAAQSLKRGRAKPKAAPPVVAVNLAFTPEQASAFLLYLERGGMTFIGTTLTPALRAEIEGAIWAAARQFRQAGITTAKDDEGQGRV